MKTRKEAKCIIDELPDRRIGMSAEDHALCPKCHPERYVKPQPTPTPPWKATFDKEYGTYIEEDTDKGFQIAKVLSQEESRNADEVYLSFTEAKANAELIVRAVNSHEELVALVKALLPFAIQENNSLQEAGEDHDLLELMIDTAEKTIAKAEGKSA